MRCLSRSPSPQPLTPPALTAGNQGRGPLPAGFVPARLHKLALMRAGKTCSKGGREGLKGVKTENGVRELQLQLQTEHPQKVAFLCRLTIFFFTYLSML